jgi:hypothetical protein
MWWTNSLADGGTFASTSAWSLAGLDLGFGTNVLTVWGTNLLGAVASDTTTVVRLPSPDTDGDGVSDWDELHTHSSNPDKQDSDGDGSPDGDEVVAGTGLMDAGSFLWLSLDEVDESSLTVSWPSVDGDRTYILEACTNLVEDRWWEVGRDAPSEPMNSVTFSPWTYGQAFFRMAVTNEP